MSAGRARHGQATNFRGYRLQPVYLVISDTERAEVIAMWRAAGAFHDTSVAEGRSREVVILVRHEASGAVAGVSTVGLKPRRSDGRMLYHLRMFIRREHRRPYLVRELTNGTRDFLRGFRHPDADPVGMLITTDNRKLMRPGMRTYAYRQGYRYLGRDRRGLDCWLAPF